MNYSELIKNNRIKAGNFSKKQIQDCLNLAKRDLNTSKKISNEDPDWGYNIAYNAMLQAGRAFMFFKGYRPTGEGQHVSTIQFLQETLPEEFIPALDSMSRMRRKRHQAVYDVAGIVSTHEVAEALKTAQFFVKSISDLINLK